MEHVEVFRGRELKSIDAVSSSEITTVPKPVLPYSGHVSDVSESTPSGSASLAEITDENSPTSNSGRHFTRDEQEFWRTYAQLRAMGSSNRALSANELMKDLRSRLSETTLSPAEQKQMELFLDPFWAHELDQFPKMFPVNGPETYAPIVVQNLVVAAGYIKEAERTSVMDFVRRSVIPPFRCTVVDIEDQVNEAIALLEESKSFCLEALKGAKSNHMQRVGEFADIARYSMRANQSAFRRQAGFQSEHVHLTGDLQNLGERQREVILLLPWPHRITKLRMKQVAQSFGGGLVFFVTPFYDNDKLTSSVVKLGRVNEIRAEEAKTAEFAPFFGLTTPRVKDCATLLEYDPHEIAAALQFELCGGVIGLPAFADAPAVVTLGQIVSDRFQLPAVETTTGLDACRSDFLLPPNGTGQDQDGAFAVPRSMSAGFKGATTEPRKRVCRADYVERSPMSSHTRPMLRSSRRRVRLTAISNSPPAGDGSDKRDDTSHIDLHAVLVEVLERNFWGFVFNTPNDGPSVRKVMPVDLVETYRIHHLINKAVTQRHLLKVEVDGIGPRKAIGFDECDPDGLIRRSLVGSKYQDLSLEEFFLKVGEKCEKEFRNFMVVTGRSHGDLHGGNLLIDSHGSAWLIDFATATSGGCHVLYDLTKLLVSSIMLYPHEYDAYGDETTNFGALFQVMAAITSNRHVIPESSYRCIEPRALHFAWELSAGLRNAAAKYENDEELHSPFPWVLAMLSWCLRISTYREPELPQLRICLYGALCMGTRIMYMDDMQAAPSWLLEANKHTVSVQRLPCIPSLYTEREIFDRELQRHLVSVATRDAWLTDPITRQQTQVCEMQTSCADYDSPTLHRSGAPRSRRNLSHRTLSPTGRRARETLNNMLGQCLSSSSTAEVHSGRVLIIGESGMGKTLLSKQLTTRAAESQLLMEPAQRHVVPIRIPLIEFPKLYREHPECLVCDPDTDFLALWSQWKFGVNGSQTRLIKIARRTSRSSEQSLQKIKEGEYVGRHLPNCLLMVVFDGLDECSNLWPQCLRFINSFLEAEPGHICVLTARPWEERVVFQLQQLHHFAAFRIMPLSDLQCEDFCRKKLMMCGTKEEDIERIVRIVCYTSEYKELRTIPLILSLLLNFHRISTANSKSAPLSKTKVYRQAVHLMLYQVGANKVASIEEGQHADLIQLNKCRMLLRHAAWAAHRDHAMTFATSARRSSVYEIEIRSRTTPVLWAELRVVAEREGLVEPLEKLISATAGGHSPLLCGDKVQFRFARLAYQQLLCGEFCACVLTQDQTLTHKLFGNNMDILREESWHEPILHCLSSMGDSIMFNWLHSYILSDQGNELSTCCFRRVDADDTRNTNTQLLLKAAVEFGSEGVVETLLHAGVSPHCRYKGSNTPLHLAAKHGHKQVVQLLVEFKALPKGPAAMNDNFRTPIQLAIAHGHLDVYRALTKIMTRRGFPTDKAVSDFAPSSDAGTIRRGASVAAPCIFTNSATQAVADCDGKNGRYTPLIKYAYDGSYNVVQAIAQQLPKDLINLRCPGSARASALCFAVEHGRAKSVEILLQAGADCRIRYGQNNCSLLYWACFAGYYEVVCLLLEANASLDACDTRDTLTPLHAAAAMSHFAIVDLLLGYGMDPLVCYRPLMLRPIHLAAFFGSDDVYNALLSHGDSCRAECKGAVAPEDLRHLHDCPPGSIPKRLQKISKEIEKLF